MNVHHITKPISLFEGRPFKRPFDGGLVVYDPQEVEEALGEPFKLSSWPKIVGEELFNYSWDGEMWWFDRETADKFLPFAEQWYQKLITNNSTFPNDNDNGICDSLLYMNTPNGLAIVDTTHVDFGSHSEALFRDFQAAFNLENTDLHYYSECHFVDHVNFIRVAGTDEASLLDAEFLTLMVAEDVFSDSLLINGLDEMDDFKDALDIEEDVPVFDEQLLSKKVVITGKFSISREEMKALVEELGFQVVDKVTSSDCWLWMGQKVGAKKITDAQKVGAKTSTVAELCEEFFVNPIRQQQPSRGMKPGC